ncbi:MAG TPA: hypothetical protein VGI95_05830 [Caulobacteraceae bacterium]|jgi:hypothetical protein
MTALIPFDRAMTDGALLGAALGDAKPWAAWRAILKASFAEPMTAAEARTFGKLAGGRKPPKRPVAELWVAAGRRSGKSRMAGLTGVYLAACVDHSARLAPGERGYVLVVAPTTGQAATVKSYCEAFLTRSRLLAPLVVSVTADEIALTNGITIAIGAASFRTLRGKTLLGVVVDEVAFLRDETSASPDVELVRAVIPSLSAARGTLIGISSPYRKIGVLAQRHRDHFGRDSDVLVIKAASTELNPTLDVRMIARAMADDPTAARSEWLAEFREDISSLLTDAAIDEAVDRNRPLELPPCSGVAHSAFVDASAGRHDAFTICIGHKDGDGFVADVIRGKRAPFNPSVVAGEFAQLARSFGCGEVVGDNFAGEWVAQAFRAAGVEYRRSDMPKSGLYLEGVSVFMRGAVSIPNLPPLIRELRLLERRTARSGKDAVDHPVGGSDDHANALFGAMRSVLGRKRVAVELEGLVAPQIVHAGDFGWDTSPALTGGLVL